MSARQIAPLDADKGNVLRSSLTFALFAQAYTEVQGQKTSERRIQKWHVRLHGAACIVLSSILQGTMRLFEPGKC